MAQKVVKNKVYQELVVHSLHHDLLRSVLTHVEPQLEFLAAGVVFVLDERRLETLEPGRVSCGMRDEMRARKDKETTDLPWLQTRRATKCPRHSLLCKQIVRSKLRINILSSQTKHQKKSNFRESQKPRNIYF